MHAQVKVRLAENCPGDIQRERPPLGNKDLTEAPIIGEEKKLAMPKRRPGN